ncbi:MAG: ABC transporter ATP-binding protein [Desulfobacterales bacterium S7086C20]|nr:MAG: ABC transporter ATP-binding protein [Desulfobacterales bacterium S7086C20]
MLEVNNIDVYHGNLQALWDVSLEVGEGERVSLIGANGAGKTTIVETVSGLLTPASGSMVFNGVRLDKEPSQRVVRLGVCLVPEERGIFFGMSVLENLELGAFHKKSRKVKDETLESVYGLFPLLKDRSRQVAGTLSGGEQQMLAIGRGLMSKPKLLMLDEPSLGLAPIIVKNIFEVIKQINRSGVSILLVEQNVRIALGLAQRAYIIENGRIIQHGDAKDLLSDEQVKDAYLGTG